MGCFAEYGWAWNMRPTRSEVGRWKHMVPSAEFVESAVIFVYGSTNVWLEHLAAWGQAWSAQDLEHVSISIMFFGGGLVGRLREFKQRPLLTDPVWYAHRVNDDSRSAQHDHRCVTCKPGSSSGRSASPQSQSQGLLDVDEPLARTHHLTSWDHDELSSATLGGCDDGPQTVGNAVRHLCACPCRNVYTLVCLSTNLQLRLAASFRTCCGVLFDLGRPHLHG